MKLTLDTEQKTLSLDNNGQTETVPLYSDRAFDLISEQWLKVGWNQRYSYTFSWMGRPVIQLPEDIVRIQEVLYQVKPDVVIETGVAHGGSLILYASLFKAMGKGRVIGVDIEIRPHNRKGIETHELGSLITLIEGSSTAPSTLDFLHRGHRRDHEGLARRPARASGMDLGPPDRRRRRVRPSPPRVRPRATGLALQRERSQPQSHPLARRLPATALIRSTLPVP